MPPWILKVSNRLPNELGRFLAISTLMVAASAKAIHLATDPIEDNFIFGSKALNFAIVSIEYLLVAWLIIGTPCQRLMKAVLVNLFLVFAIISAIRSISGYDSCGCFGIWHVNPKITFIIDVVLLMLLLKWEPSWFASVSSPSGSTLVLTLALLAITNTAAFALDLHRNSSVFIATEQQPMGVVILKPRLWQGKEFPLAPQVADGGEMMRGRWNVILYQSQCQKCRTFIAKRLTTLRGTDAKLALILVPGKGSGDFSDLESERIKHFVLDKSVKWFAQTPVLFVLQDGLVVDTESSKH